MKNIKRGCLKYSAYHISYKLMKCVLNRFNAVMMPESFEANFESDLFTYTILLNCVAKFFIHVHPTKQPTTCTSITSRATHK